jgi:regulator of protease activity HflC (stomatin/prohibitin superfamily)
MKGYGNYDGVVGGLLAVMLLGGLFLLCGIFGSVPAGHIGVLDEMGIVKGTLEPGFYFKVPWAKVELVSLQTKQIEETADTPTSEGLTVGLDVSLLYRVEGEKAVQIYKTIGTSYEDTIIKPTFRSAIRDVSARHDAKYLYTSERAVVEREIYEMVSPALKDRGIVVEGVLLRSVSVPDNLKEGIEAKLVAEQDAERMEFILQKEQQEAERKVVEARGIAEAQGIIDKSLTSQYLSWYWISNLGKYNAVIYVPVGDNGLPLFKDVDNTDDWGIHEGAFSNSTVIANETGG